jgi:ketosteroid isomerase-like protein
VRAVTTVAQFVDRWQEAVAARDLGALAELLRDDVVFRSPVVHAPTTGRGPTSLVLAAVTEVFGPLEYTHAYLDEPDGVTLEFRTSVTGDDGRRLDVDGVDVFRLDGDGRIAALTVMLRPLSATLAVGARMREQLGV